MDAVYNPLRTPLVRAAQALGIPAEGGLYMLVAQAILSSEIFLDKKYEKGVCDGVFRKISREKENIILIGMPASGKTTLSRLLAERLSRKSYDTDDMVVEKEGREIKEIFAKDGERYFREIEAACVKEVSVVSSAVIATGGGVILNPENIDALRQNGRIYFIDRPLSSLVPTDSRPLSQDRESIEKRYYERYEKYRAAADVIIDADCSVERVLEKILEDFQN
jgi:shikimate dehydrogenase